MDSDDKASWDYKPSGSTAVADRPQAESSASGSTEPPDSKSSMVWTASEFIEHQRGAGWYVALVLVTAALAALAYLISRDYFALGVMIIVGIIVGVAAGRKPREVKYELTTQGIHVGEKVYKYGRFRSFSIIREGSLSYVELIPLKKLMIPVSAYFGPGDEERIMDVIGQHLPYEERKMDAVDRLSRKLRF